MKNLEKINTKTYQVNFKTMRKKNINEQTKSGDFLNQAVTFGCFTPNKYDWFTIDETNPVQVIDGKNAVVGKMDDEIVYFFEPEPGKKIGYYQVKGGTKQYPWECDMLKSRQETFINSFISKNLGYKKDVTDYELGREYEEVDLNTLAPKIFSPNERFIYKKINTTNTDIQQQTPIETALGEAGYTLTVPKVTTPEYGDGLEISALMPTYKQYYVASDNITSSTMVYPMTTDQKDEFNKKNAPTDKDGSTITQPSIDQSTMLKDLLDKSKNKDIPKSDCKMAIKSLYNMKQNNTKINDADLLKLKKVVFGCYNQNTKFSSGAFGVEDELKNLELDYNRYGIAGMIRSSEKQKLGESVSMKNIIKENLIKASEKKQNKLLSENTIIVNRYKLLTENINPRSKKDVKKFFDLLMTETAYLHTQDYDKDLIKEGFFDLLSGLFGNASTGIFQYFKEHIAKWLVTKFGFDPNSWLGNMVIVAVGNLPLTELHNLTNCSFVSKMLAKDIAEGAINKIKNEQGLSGPGYDILRNAMVEMAEQSSFGQSIENKISDFICPKLQGLTSKLGDVTQKIKSNALSTNTSNAGSKVKGLANTGIDKLKSLVS